ITTGELRGIRVIAKVGEIGDWNLDSGVLYSELRSGLNTIIKATGDVAFATGAPNSKSTTDANLQIWHDGTLRFRRSATRIESDANYDLHLQAHNWIRLKARATVETDSRIIPDLNKTHNLGEGNLRWNNVYSDAFRTQYGAVQSFDVTSTEVWSERSLYLRPENNIIYAQGHLRPRFTSTFYLGNTNYRWIALYTRDGVNESSDERLKKNIRKIDTDLLNYAEDIKPIMYEDEQGKTSFGYSAQDVQRTLTKYSSKVLGINESETLERFGVIGKGESYLSLRYRDVEVMKGALRDKKIEELENRIKELENAS